MSLMRRGALFAGKLFAGVLFGQAQGVLGQARDWLIRARRRLRR